MEDNDLARNATGDYADVFEFADGRLQVRHKGMALPFRVFDPHQQRVTHAAITENTRLSAVLAFIKSEQEKVPVPVMVPPSSAATGYQKTGRRPPGRPSRLELSAPDGRPRPQPAGPPIDGGLRPARLLSPRSR